MKVTVKITKSFTTAVKPLLKKYPSLPRDLSNLENDLIVNPKLGTALGKNIYKIRLKISSKGNGKSGGARVISLVDPILIGVTEKISEEEINVFLVTIYDKADIDNISDKELKELIRNAQF